VIIQICAPGGIRTLNLSVRSASLYPLSYWGFYIKVKANSSKSLSPQQATGHYGISPFGTDFA
jgi:hypothetical protein